MDLTPPRKISFFVAVLAIIVGAVAYLFADGQDFGYWVTFGGGVLLALSVSMKGI